MELIIIFTDILKQQLILYVDFYTAAGCSMFVQNIFIVINACIKPFFIALGCI